MLEQLISLIFLNLMKICGENNLDDLFNEGKEIFSVLEKYAVPLERKSADNTTNTYGDIY